MAPGGGRDFNCSWEQCGKSFNRKSDLCRHYRIHTNERPYHCTHENCNKSFIQRSALTVHSRTHTGEKPHVCDHDGCHKAFSDSSSLARHRRIHTGKRPYICNEPACERSFCRKTTLTKHQHRSHHTQGTRLSSEEIIPEESTPYQPSVATKTSSISSSSPLSSSAPSATSLPSNQYLLTQQPYYQPPTPNNEYFPSQHGMPLPQVPGQEPQAIQPHQIPPPPSINMQYTPAMQPRYDTINRSPYLPPEYHQLPPYTVHHIPSDGHPIMVTYPQDYPYKSSPRLMSQHEGTDWGFLGVS